MINAAPTNHYHQGGINASSKSSLPEVPGVNFTKFLANSPQVDLETLGNRINANKCLICGTLSRYFTQNMYLIKLSACEKVCDHTYSVVDVDGENNLLCRLCQISAARRVVSSTVITPSTYVPWWHRINWNDSVDVFDKGLILPQIHEIQSFYHVIESNDKNKFLLQEKEDF